MPANNRIYYATQAVALKGQNADGTSVDSNWYYPRGLQSVGITTNFGLEQVFQIGQLELYDNVENVPEVEVTMSKSIDGTPPLYLLCMGGSSVFPTASTMTASTKELAELANNRINFRLGIYSDIQVAATGTPVTYVDCSGMYLSSVSYNIPIEGVASEDITLVGNNKVWNSGILGGGMAGAFSSGNASDLGGRMTAPSLARRFKLLKAGTVLPTGLGGGIPTPEGLTFPRVQSIKVSTNLGREAIYELGAMAPYFRYVKFPVEVTSEIEIIATSGDAIDAQDFTGAADCTTTYRNLQDKKIFVTICGSGGGSSMGLDLGAKNKLTSVNYNGGDTGGGNASVTYSYQTFNKLVVIGSGSFIQSKWVDNTDSADIVGD
jgi:hypothetical protein